MIRLPIDELIPDILNQLQENLVLVAAPGAGKTTRLPPALLSKTDKQVLVLEPRRMAAVAAAHRIAEENNWQVGEQVGYQVRFENKTSAKTRLIFKTEALLSRQILSDPELRDVGVVVLDEFHERSIHVDLALGLLRELQLVSRPDLKIVVMSATLDAAAVAEHLGGAPIVDSPGRLFDLQLQKTKDSQLIRTDHRFVDRMCAQIKSVYESEKRRDILVFLPGQSEIRRVQNQLADWSARSQARVLPLYGSLSLSEQMQALKPAASQRKIILSTNVAESSVTIDGVDTVIDSGLTRLNIKNPRTGFEQLITTRISKASSRQRAGRAARQFPGISYQMWSPHDELSMSDFEKPEIHRVDLAQTVLFLKSWGIADVMNFTWLEKPKVLDIQNAENLLEKMGALASGKITDHGQELLKYPLEPRLSQVLSQGKHLGCAALAVESAALLQNPLGLRGSNHHLDCDLTAQLEALQNATAPRNELQRVENAIAALKKLLPTANQKITDDSVSELMLLSYPDRICRRRKSGSLQGLMMGGRGVELSQNSVNRKSDFFLAIDLIELEGKSETVVSLAVPISMELLKKHYVTEFKEVSDFVYDVDTKKYYVEIFKSLWGLPLEEPRRRSASLEEIIPHLPELCIREISWLLKENEGLQHFHQRYQFYVTQKKMEDELFEKAKLLEIFESASYGEKSLEAVAQKDLVSFFKQALPPETVKDLNQMCPGDFLLPSGKHAKIHYPEALAPFIEARLQEFFGLAQNPSIMNGKIPLSLHLLGPNFRPVQITSDLMSFWKNTYLEVKKELKPQYPRHYWPDNPLEAEPKVHTKPRRS